MLSALKLLLVKHFVMLGKVTLRTLYRNQLPWPVVLKALPSHGIVDVNLELALCPSRMPYAFVCLPHL